MHDSATAAERAAPQLASPVWSRPGHFVRSLLTLGLGQVGSWLAGAALTLLIPRYLGDVNLGKFSFAAATVNLIALIASLGTSALVTREVARDPRRARELAINALLTRVPLSVIAGVAVLLFVEVAVHDPLTRTIFLVAGCGIAFGSLTDVSLAMLQGLHRMRALAVFSVAAKVAYGALGVAVLYRGGNAVQLVEVSLIVSAGGAGVLLYTLHRAFGLRAAISSRLMISLVVGGLPFFVWQAALVIYGQVDIVMLAFMAGDAVVGWYSIAYKIVLIPGFVPFIAMTVLFPALSGASRSPEAFAQIARRSLHYLLLLSLPMSLGMLLLADRIIDFAGYPPAFHNSVVPLAILSLHMPLVAVDMLIGTMLNALDRQRQWAMVGVGAAVLNPLMNAAAIPLATAATGNAGIGSAVVVVLTELFLLLAGLRLLPAGTFGPDSWPGLVRCLVATGAMAVLVWWLRALPLPIATACGGLAFAAAAFGLGAINRSDIREVRRALARRRVVAAAGENADPLLAGSGG